MVRVLEVRALGGKIQWKNPLIRSRQSSFVREDFTCVGRNSYGSIPKNRFPAMYRAGLRQVPRWLAGDYLNPRNQITWERPDSGDRKPSFV